jgi:hypothetical protein
VDITDGRFPFKPTHRLPINGLLFETDVRFRLHHSGELNDEHFRPIRSERRVMSQIRSARNTLPFRNTLMVRSGVSRRLGIPQC